MDTELHITVQHAGNPQKLSELLEAAIGVQKEVVRTVIPTGYRCIECDAGDGSHNSGCSMIIASQVRQQSGGEK